MSRMKDLAIELRNLEEPGFKERSKRGKRARNRGNSFEREVAAKLNGKRVGQYGGKTDVQSEWIAVQCKVGKSYPERMDGWLRAISVKGDQLAALVMGDSPGPGKRRRTMIILDLDDFIAWFGKEGQPDVD